jgi:hypothetical protein
MNYESTGVCHFTSLQNLLCRHQQRGQQACEEGLCRAERRADPGKELGGSPLINGGQACQPEGTADLKAGAQAMGILPGCPLQDAVEGRPLKLGSERSLPTGEARAAQGLEEAGLDHL